MKLAGTPALWYFEATSCAELQRAAKAAVDEAEVLGSKDMKTFFFQGMVKSFNPLIPLVQHQHWFRPMVGTWVNLPASLPNLGLRVSSQTILSVTLATCWSFQYRRYGYLSQQRIWKLDQKWLQWKCQSCYLMKFIIISMLLVRDFG